MNFSLIVNHFLNADNPVSSRAAIKALMSYVPSYV